MIVYINPNLNVSGEVRASGKGIMRTIEFLVIQIKPLMYSWLTSHSIETYLEDITYKFNYYLD